MATITADGAPHVVPCCFVLVGDTVYSAVDAKPKSTLALKRIANIEGNGRASLVVDHYDDDWSRLWWVRADGTARVVASDDERLTAVQRLTEKYDQYRTIAIDGPVIAVDVTQWRGWSSAPS